MDPFIGEIRLLALNFAPQDWQLCDGSSLNIQQYPALYSILGTRFGGDGKTYFQVPDLRGRTATQASTTRPFGKSYGETSVTLGLNQIPAHQHTLTAALAAAADLLPKPGNNEYIGHIGGGLTVETYSTTNTSPVSLNVQAIAPTADKGGAHENQQPYLVLNYMIATMGTYPLQPD